jgi:hypothetical protein
MKSIVDDLILSREFREQTVNDYLFNKKRKTFFTLTLFSEWITEMDHHECTTGGGVGCTSDETFSLIHEKINEFEKGFFIEHEALLFNVFFWVFLSGAM